MNKNTVGFYLEDKTPESLDIAMIHLRGFKKEDKAEMFKLQGGIDPIDGKSYSLDEFHAHHIHSFRSGGISAKYNMVLVCKESHKKIHADGLYSPEQVAALRDDLVKKNGYSRFF